MSLLTDTPARQMLCASNQMATDLEEVQFTVQEGPCITAAETGEQTHLTDWNAGARQWPLFTAGFREKHPDVQGVHAFPLWFGDYVLGSVDVATRVPGGLTGDAIEQATEAVDAVAQALLPAQQMLLEEDEYPPWEPAGVLRAHWSDTHCAIGVVAVKEEINTDDALALMRAQAFATGRTLAEITADILRT
ncbi:GAF and ANTAR domain-containing protein [Streptomyces cyaneofuscatus]|uniref:GAF and ANTAR domain-containing protein n=1 Tax=Streptomyces cyaneofuscatus TaxID=66883 RepID=UPI0037BD7AB8